MKKISNTLIIPPGSQERFLHFTDTSKPEEYSGGRICGGISDPLMPGYRVIYWKHPAQEWIYVIRGIVTFFWEGETVRAEKGDFVFLPSQLEPHSIAVEDEAAGMIWFHVRPEKDDREWYISEKKPFCRKALFGNEISLLAELLILQEENMDTERQNTIDQIRDYLLREAAADIAPEQFHREALLKVFEMVRQDLSRNWQVSELAQGAFLSDSHFFALTRQYFGESPQNYIRKLRMAHGKHLLMRTDLTLNQIAEACGYKNGYAFSKAFRKYSGESPGKVRRIIKKS